MMEFHTDSFLSTVDRVSRRLGPISSLVALIADRVAPQTTARAACLPPDATLCYITCEYDNCCNGPIGNRWDRIEYYKKPGSNDCGNPAKCSAGCYSLDCQLCGF
jgi:hypothetical protein